MLCAIAQRSWPLAPQRQPALSPPRAGVGGWNACRSYLNPNPDPYPNQGRVNELKQERLFNITYLQQQHGITPHHVDVLHRRATLA